MKKRYNDNDQLNDEYKEYHSWRKKLLILVTIIVVTIIVLIRSI